MNVLAVFNDTAWRTHFKNPCTDAAKSPYAVARTLFQQAGAPFNVTVPTAGIYVAAVVSCHTDTAVRVNYRVSFVNPGNEHLPRDVCRTPTHPTNTHTRRSFPHAAPRARAQLVPVRAVLAVFLLLWLVLCAAAVGNLVLVRRSQPLHAALTGSLFLRLLCALVEFAFYDRWHSSGAVGVFGVALHCLLQVLFAFCCFFLTQASQINSNSNKVQTKTGLLVPRARC